MIEQVDRLLDAYGALGAVGRDKQLSTKIVADELSQLKVMGTVLPSIFLAVAMFILNVVHQPPGGHAAQPDRRAQGAGLQRRRHRVALHQALAW